MVPARAATSSASSRNTPPCSASQREIGGLIRRSPFVVVATFAALIVIGLALATIAPELGTVVAVAGIVLLAAYLLTVFRIAWSGDQKRAWDPGSLYREHHDEGAAQPK